jgi:hypothetical protein
MFLVQGPFPLIQSSIILPSPRVGNTNSLTSSIQVLRMSDGSTHTYVKAKRGRRKYRYDFSMSRDKMDELRSFIEAYAGKPVKVTDHNDVIRIGYLTLNPFESQGIGRAKGSPGGEFYTTTIELEEKV